MFNTHQRKSTNKSCPEQLLELLQDRADWISTDEMVDKGIIDYRTSKFILKKRGHIFDRKTEAPEKVNGMYPVGTRFKTYYKWVGYIPGCHAEPRKRDYIDKFSEGELISELWRRDRLAHTIFNDGMYTIIK